MSQGDANAILRVEAFKEGKRQGENVGAALAREAIAYGIYAVAEERQAAANQAPTVVAGYPLACEAAALRAVAIRIRAGEWK